MYFFLQLEEELLPYLPHENEDEEKRCSDFIENLSDFIQGMNNFWMYFLPSSSMMNQYKTEEWYIRFYQEETVLNEEIEKLGALEKLILLERKIYNEEYKGEDLDKQTQEEMFPVHTLLYKAYIIMKKYGATDKELLRK